MTVRAHSATALSACLCAVLLVVAGCAKAPPVPPGFPAGAAGGAPAAAPEPPRTATITLVHDGTANPDGQGRPLPVHVRVYQLRGDAPFKSAAFFQVASERDVLGETLVAREERFLQIGSQEAVPLTLAREATYIGIVAELRDVRNAEWRVLLPAQAGDRRLTISAGGLVAGR
jgi:type VI secretion system protein VasD